MPLIPGTPIGQVMPASRPDAMPRSRKRCSNSMRFVFDPISPNHARSSYIDTIVSKEINSATDNPLISGKDGGGFEIISGGNFHGQYLAQAMDLLAIAVTDLGSICERRIARIIDPIVSWGLPRNLMSGVRGVNTGYPVVQCSPFGRPYRA